MNLSSEVNYTWREGEGGGGGGGGGVTLADLKRTLETLMSNLRYGSS